MFKTDTDNFLHPLDKKCADRVMNSKIIKGILDMAFQENLDEVFQHVYSASNVRVPSDSEINRYIDEGCRMFGVKNRPKVYIVRSYYYDIECSGFDTPVMLIPELLMENADETILRGRVMAAVASIKAEHNKLNFLAWIVDNFGLLIPIPFSGYFIQSGISEWLRAQQYSVDRAFLLATGSYKLAQKNILFGKIPMDILGNFEFGVQGTFDAQVKDFYGKETVGEYIGVIKSMCQREVWIPAQYKEFEAFWRECGGEL